MYTYLYACIHIYVCVYIYIRLVCFSRVQLFVTPWTVALQASLSISNSQSLLKLKSIESVMPANNLIFCLPTEG